jgi:hypothetical protein
MRTPHAVGFIIRLRHARYRAGGGRTPTPHQRGEASAVQNDVGGANPMDGFQKEVFVMLGLDIPLHLTEEAADVILDCATFYT